jgi:hypothetical protein
VHTNTVRNRLRRAAELCGHAPTDARGAFTIQLALVLGRLSGYGPARSAGPQAGAPERVPESSPSTQSASL